MYTQAIRYHAAASPDNIAIAIGGRRLTYRQFETHINCFSQALKPLVDGSQVVGVRSTRPYLEWLLTLALSRLGKTSLSVPPQGLSKLSGKIVDSVIICDDRPFAGDANEIRLSQDEVKAIFTSAPVAPPAIVAQADDPARIAVSSGTTGMPKAVQVSHGLVVSRMKSGIFGSAMRFDRQVYCQLPIGTFGGFGMPLRTWYLGGTVHLGQISLRDLHGGAVRTLVTTPGGLGQLARMLPVHARPIAGLTIIVGGAALPPNLAEQVRAHLCTDIILSYGSTETTTVAACSARSRMANPDLTGIVLPWVDLEVVDDQDRPVPTGSVGQVRIRSADMVHAYLNDTQATAAAFRDGWFYPGDLGRLGPNRELFITGRSDFLMNLNGYKLAPELVEQVICGCPGVIDAAVGSLRSGDFVRAVGLVVHEPSFDLVSVREAIARSFPQIRNLILRSAPAIPRNEMGKVDRAGVAELIARSDGNEGGELPDQDGVREEGTSVSSS